ncbi:tyrosine-protein phosphatase [Streptomyces albulus]|nr:tyrosine-protein phosphatase [Streptomyces noursei]
MPLVNFRDVADNAGPRLRPGLLYRSARPTGLTAAELAAAAPGLRCVVDLRGPDERTAADWAAADALGATVLNLPGQGSPTDLAALPPAPPSAGSTPCCSTTAPPGSPRSSPNSPTACPPW